jgi:hypothetical protein
MADITQAWQRAYEQRYMGSWTLFDAKTRRYREVTARIDRVTCDEVIGEGGRRSTPVQLFLSGRKGPFALPMILSKSNATTIQVMTGSPIPKDWEGLEITIYVQKGKRVRAGTGDILKIRNTKAGAQLREELQERVEPITIPEEDLTDGGDDAQTDS